MKNLILLFFVIVSVKTFSQTYVKANTLLVPLGIINAAIEDKISNKISVQAETMFSPWKSYAGNHMQIYTAQMEGRYYFKETFQHWYVGANFGFSFFDVQKWNYWNTDLYQRGYAIMAGATVGYQMKWKYRWNLDFFLGGGTIQGNYHGYSKIVGGRYDGQTGWNKSGEWFPFKGGIMLAYQFL